MIKLVVTLLNESKREFKAQVHIIDIAVAYNIGSNFVEASFVVLLMKEWLT
jgi:hypothetical protein